MNDNRRRYPATVEINYPDRPLDRLTTFFRPFMAVPIVVPLALVSALTIRGQSTIFVIGSGGIVFMATLLMLLFRRKYPPVYCAGGFASWTTPFFLRRTPTHPSACAPEVVTRLRVDRETIARPARD